MSLRGTRDSIARRPGYRESDDQTAQERVRIVFVWRSEAILWPQLPIRAVPRLYAQLVHRWRQPWEQVPTLRALHVQTARGSHVQVLRSLRL